MTQPKFVSSFGLLTTGLLEVVRLRSEPPMTEQPMIEQQRSKWRLKTTWIP